MVRDFHVNLLKKLEHSADTVKGSMTSCIIIYRHQHNRNTKGTGEKAMPQKGTAPYNNALISSKYRSQNR